MPTETKIKLNNKDDLTVLRQNLKTALEMVAEDFGISINLGNCSYESDGSGCTFKMNVRAIGHNGEVITKEAKALKLYEKLLGLPEGWEDKFFTNRGQAYRLIGFKPNSPKFCIQAEDMETKKILLFTKDVIKLLK